MDNYISVLSDRTFIQAVRNTIQYTFLCVPITLCIALIIACILTGNVKFKALFQTAIFLPMVTSVSAVGYAWRLMFHDTYGIVNYLLEVMNLESTRWLSDPNMSMPLLLAYGVWAGLPISVLLLINAISGIDPKLYQAAKIDGANGCLRFFRITLPGIKGTIILLFFTNAAASIKVFDELYPLFSGKPGPTYNLHTIVYYIYTKTQGPNIYGYGQAAAAAILLLSIMLTATIVTTYLRTRETKV